MTAITTLTTEFPEITPLSTKSERFYNQPPVNKHELTSGGRYNL